MNFAFRFWRWIVIVHGLSVGISITRKDGSPLRVTDYFIIGSLFAVCFAAEAWVGVVMYRSLVRKYYPEEEA